MHTATLHTHAGSYGINTVVVALNGNLCALTRHAGNLLNGDQSVVDLGHLSLQQTLQEHGARTAQDDLRVVVLVGHLMDDGTNGLTLAILVGRDLLRLRQDQLVVLIINEQHLTLPYLIDLTAHDLSYTILVLVVQAVVFQFENL